MDMKCRHRTFYEILQPNQSCHLYFDIEYDKLLNPNRDGESAVGIFKRFLVEKILSIFGLHISNFVRDENDRFSGHLIELDASNYKKFSKHLIVILPGPHFFKDNKHVGEFVDFLCNEIKVTACLNNQNDSLSLSPLVHSLRQQFRGDIIQNVLFIDQTVYGALQNFRLILSAKFSDIGRRHFNLYLSGEKKALEHSSITENVFKSTMASYPASIQTKPHQIISWKTDEEKNPRAVVLNSLVSNRSGIPLLRNPALGQVLVSAERMFPNVMKYFPDNIAKSCPR